jgi:ribulose-5-phosphate 4-epimerase/fuculose-1-phosphate aldolase
MGTKKKCLILGGGTMSHIGAHLALTAPAYGKTARQISEIFPLRCKEKLETHLVTTKMATDLNVNTYWDKDLDTIDDVSELVDKIVKDLSVKIVFFNIAMVDFNFKLKNPCAISVSDPKSFRLQSDNEYEGTLIPNEKIIKRIRKDRKDIFLIGFKATAGATPHEQFLKGLKLCKESSCNLVLANDVVTRNNMIITPEEAVYSEMKNRSLVLTHLIDMAIQRSHLTFTRSTVVSGEDVPWRSKEVPETLREVIDYCIERGAYKAFRGATVGHFAVKLDETTFLTSKRKTNFNNIYENGLVKIKTDKPDHVLAYGSKPSVGGQSQRIIFKENPDYNCIVHFHCPLKPNRIDDISIMSQKEYECGSHECGQNTALGLKKHGNFSAVHLDNHGPNIVFNSDEVSEEEIINFIEANWDLKKKSGGYLVGEQFNR